VLLPTKIHIFSRRCCNPIFATHFVRGHCYNIVKKHSALNCRCGRKFYILNSIFYHHFEYFTAIWYTRFKAVWYSLWSLGIFFPFWYVWTKKNLATLFTTLTLAPEISCLQTFRARHCLHARPFIGWRIVTRVWNETKKTTKKLSILRGQPWQRGGRHSGQKLDERRLLSRLIGWTIIRASICGFAEKNFRTG
jgi:hypothetical protein